MLMLLVASSSVARADGSLSFFVNEAGEHDYGLQLELPPGFGAGEMTLEIYLKPDESFPVGSTASGAEQLTNWSDADNPPYSSGGWWFAGNFLLDGHNNASFADGTFSLQLYGGGRIRWLFGDGEVAGPGGHWSVGAFPASATPSLLDGQWHLVTLVRRWSGATAADLELWVDGQLVALETSPARTDMRAYWESWGAFPPGQEGWFWGAEKQAAIGELAQYEDYKGLVDELRFWSRARSPEEIAASVDQAVVGNEVGLVGHFTFGEGAGSAACDGLAVGRCIDLFRQQPGAWDEENAPLDGIFSDGFESGDTLSWSGGAS